MVKRKGTPIWSSRLESCVYCGRPAKWHLGIEDRENIICDLAHAMWQLLECGYSASLEISGVAGCIPVVPTVTPNTTSCISSLPRGRGEQQQVNDGWSSRRRCILSRGKFLSFSLLHLQLLTSILRVRNGNVNWENTRARDADAPGIFFFYATLLTLLTIIDWTTCDSSSSSNAAGSV